MEQLIEAGRARRGDRLHAVRARQLAARRHPRHRPGPAARGRPPRPAAGRGAGLRGLLQPGPARRRCPSATASRKSYFHNPVATLVRLTAEEETDARADRRRAPQRGARAGARGRPDARASRSPTPRAATSGTRRPTARSWTRCARPLRPDIPYETVDAHVDDPTFADVVAERYLTLTQEPAHAG